MAMRISRPIFERLQKRGLIPPNCANLELLIPPNAAMTLRYEVFLTEKECDALGEAFTEMANESREREEHAAKRKESQVV